MVAHTFKRTVYLKDEPRDKALANLLNQFNPTREIEWIDSHLALGRITAQPIFAISSMPHYHASAMDGIAVVSEMTFSAHEQNPLQLKQGTDFIYVDTGNIIPPPYDSVIMIENIQEIDSDTIEIIEPSSPWQHIRPIGEDIVQEEMLFTQGHKIRPVDIGALLAARVLKVPVIKKPKVTIIPTGNELVTPETPVDPGKLIEFNGSVFKNYVTEWGGDPYLYPIVKDDPLKIEEALLEATKISDIVVINAGSSAGSKDFTVHIIGKIGQVFTHGIATRPGKPVILGKINDTIVVGVPGYPVSAYLAFEWFVQPLICDYLQIAVPKRPKLQVKLGRRIVGSMGAEDYVRMSIGFVDNEFVANPLTRSAGVTMSLVKADGLLIIPPTEIGYEQGDLVEVELYRTKEEIMDSIAFIGSHDLTIDLLSSHLKQERNTAKIMSSHVGSLAGIMAIKKKEAQVAGIHLLDPETKVYNTSYIKRFLPTEEVVLLPFLRRKQGFIVQKGNPLAISTIEDIVKNKVSYVNRQKGAGTRILFDLLLKEAGYTADTIIGYQREMFSHLSVAAEVKAQKRACGLAIYPVAKAMNLDFIPVADESYDLLMTRDFFESEQGQLLVKMTKKAEFIKQVEQIGGYEVVLEAEPIYFNKK